MVTVLLVAVLLYALLVAAFFLAQRTIQYPAPRQYLAPGAVGLEGVSVHRLPTDDGAAFMVWWLPPPTDEAPVAIYFHGNGETLWNLAERIEQFAADGFGLAAVSYRGYPGSEGRASEAAFIADALAAHAFVTGKGVAPERIVAVGYSIGSGVAVALAAERPVGAVVLYAPFTSAADIARSVYPFLPVGPLMLDQFRSDERIGRVTAPVAIVHGSADRIVPIRFGERLHALAGEPSLFVRLEGEGHILPVDAGREAVLAFLSETAGLPVGPAADAATAADDATGR